MRRFFGTILGEMVGNYGRGSGAFDSPRMSKVSALPYLSQSSIQWCVVEVSSGLLNSRASPEGHRDGYSMDLLHRHITQYSLYELVLSSVVEQSTMSELV